MIFVLLMLGVFDGGRVVPVPPIVLTFGRNPQPINLDDYDEDPRHIDPLVQAVRMNSYHKGWSK